MHTSIRYRDNLLYDLDRYETSFSGTVYPVFGNGLTVRNMDLSLAPVYEPKISILLQQEKLRKLISYYNSYINTGKIFGSEEYVTRFISALNMQLFGYLGGKKFVEETKSEYPFWDHLSVSKGYFTKDLLALSQAVKNWEIKGDRIITNPLYGSESSFVAKGKSLEFFNVLKLLDGIELDTKELPGSKAGKASFRFGLEAAASFFGTYPYESVLGYKIGSVNQTSWEPFKTAGIINESLRDENSISMVLKLLEKTKKNRDIIVSDIDYKSDNLEHPMGIKRINYLKKTEIETTVKISYINYDLKVIDTGRLENYAVEIPINQIYTIENFIENTKEALRTEVPFILNAEFYILEGPVTVEKRIVYQDPIVLCIFREFPNTYIPVEAWLPDQTKLLKMHESSLNQAQMVNTFDADQLSFSRNTFRPVRTIY